MNEMQIKTRQVLRRKMAELRDEHPSKSRDYVVALFIAALAEWPAALREEAWREAGERYFEELSRQRRKGFRRSYRVNGQDMSLFDITPREASLVVAGEEAHAAGAVERAAYDRFTLTLAEERCREQGLDPATTDLLVGDFIDADEAQELWHKRAS